MPGPRAVPPPNHEISTRGRWFLWLFSIALIVVAGSAFVMKLIDFTATATQEGTGALASFLIPVLNYLLVAGGFFCLFFWAYSKGHYKDIEAPKHRMLELDREYERVATLEAARMAKGGEPNV